MRAWARRFSRAGHSPTRSRASAEALEQRVLYSADPLGGDLWNSAAEVRVLQPALKDSNPAEATLAVPTLAPEATPIPEQAPAASRVKPREIIFVDGAVANAEELLDQLVTSRGLEAGVQVMTIASDEDGLAAIGRALQAEQGITTVHIISHGMAGVLLLGNQAVDADTLLTRQDELGDWRHALQENADVLLWGCDVGSGTHGQDLLQELALLTGADVAASTDATGAAALGGNWVLERSTGSIEALADLPFAPQWDGLLTITANGAASSATTNGASSLSWSHTVAAGSNRVMFVTLAIDAVGAGVSSVTYDGVALTQVGRTAGNHAVEIWRLASPTVGTANVVVSFTGTTAVAGGAVVYNGVNLASPTSGYNGATGTGTTAAVNVASAAGDLVLDVTNWDGGAGGYAVGGGQSIVWSDASTFNSGRTSAEAGAATVTMSSTVSASAQWEMAGVSINAANEAPVNTVPAAQSTNEDTALVFSSGNGNAISITDADAGGANNEITLSVTQGTLTLAGTGGLSFVSGDGTADASMRLRGTASAINAALNGLSFMPSTGYVGGSTLTMTSKDSVLLSLEIDTQLQARYEFSGNADDSGSGPAQNGTLTNGASIATDVTRGDVLNLDGSNDFVDLSSSVASFSGLTQGTIAGWIKATGTFETIFSISDTADTGSYTTLLLGSSGYLTFSVVENGVEQLNVYRNSAAINDGTWHHVAVTVGPSGNRLYVDGVQAGTGDLTYDAGTAATQRFFNHVTSLDAMAVGRTMDSSGGKWHTLGQLDEVRLYDRVLSASEVADLANDLNLVDADTVAVTVNAFNAAPVNTVPAAQSTNEDIALVFSSGNGNAISITDADAGGANNEITLSVTQGTLTLAGTGGLSFVSGDGTADASMRFRGTAAAINAALDGLAFAPPTNVSGGATLTMASKDSVLLNLDIGASLSARYSFENSGNLGQDSSPAAAYPAASVGATAVLDGTRGNVVSLTGASNSNLQVSGLLGTPGAVSLAAWVNLSTADSSGSEVISMGDRVGLRVDQGGWLKGWFSYSGGTRFTETAVTLAGTGWHHVAYATDPGNSLQVLYLDGVAVASTAHTDAILWTGGGSDTVIGSHGNGGTTYDFGGRLDEVRIYNRALDADEAYTLANDLSMGDTDTVAVTVNAVNDAPVLVNTALAMAVAEDAGAPSGAVGSLVSLFTGGISDADGPARGIAITNTNETNGTWHFSTDGGTTWSAVGAVSDTSALLLADNASTRLYFAPANNFAGVSSAALTLRAWDQTSGGAGNKVSTASNGGSTAFSSANNDVDVSVTAVNDAPTNSLPGAQVTAVNTPLVLSGSQAISVADVDATNLRVTIAVTHGTLTLATTAGLSWNTGDGTADASMVFTGGTAAINAALDGAQFTPSNGFFGAATLSLLTEDLGATGAGGPQSDSDTLNIVVGGQRFQEGVNGYVGTQDTFVRQYAVLTSYGSDNTIELNNWLGLAEQGLIRFDQVIGSGVGQIPPGSTITSAALSMYVSNANNMNGSATVALHRMLSGWNEGSTWFSMDSGVQTDNSEAASTASRVISANQSGWVTFANIGADLQAWSNGAANHGWALLTDDWDAWDAHSSEFGTASLRPYLTVSFTPPQPAVVNASGGSATYTENGAPVAVDPGLLLSDADSSHLTGASVAITSGFVSGQDSLNFANQSGITGSWNAGTGVLTLSGTATIAQYQTALRSVSFANNSDAFNTSPRTVSFSVQDAWIAGGTDSRSVALVAVNDAPALSSGATVALTGTDEDTTSPAYAVHTLLTGAGWSDVDTAPSPGMAIIGATGNGTWQFSVDGSTWANIGPVTGSNALLLDGGSQLRYNPDNINGETASLSFRGWDQTSGSAATPALPVYANPGAGGGTSAFSAQSASASLVVSPVNDAPVLSAAGLTVAEGQTVTLTAGNITVADIDSTAFTFTLSGLAGGFFQLSSAAGTAVTSFTTAQLNAGLVQFVDDGDETAPAFSLTASDGALNSNTVAASISYTPVNDAPIISAASLTVSEGQTMTLAAGDVSVTDPDSSSFNFAATGLAGGFFQLSTAVGTAITSFTSAQLNAGLVQFVDDGDETAPSFSLTASDGALNSNTLASVITYAPVNDAPVLGTVSLVLDEGEILTLAPGNVAVSDDDNTAFTFTISGLSGGFFQLSSAAGTAIGSFTTAQLGAGIVQFVDDGDETAPGFSLTANDGALNSNTVAASISATPVNDAPVLSAASLTVGEGATVSLSAGNFTVVDPDSSAFTFSISALAGGYFQLSNAAGTPITSFTTAQLNAGLVQFVDDGDEMAPSFSVTASDGALNSNTLSVSVTLTPDNDAPSIVAAALATTEGLAATLGSGDISVSDPDSSSFSFTVTALSGGYFQLTSAAGVAITSFSSAQLSAGLVQFVDDGDEVAPSFSLTANDGALNSNTVAASISATPVNDAPVLSAASLTVGEGATVTLSASDFTVIDPDSSAFTFSISAVAGGFFQLSSAAGTSITSFTTAQLNAGLVQFVDDGDETAPAFTVTASDGALSSNAMTASVAYTSANDAPLIISADLTVSEGSTVPLLPSNIVVNDPDNTVFSFTVSALSGGIFQLSNAPGTAITSFTTTQLSAGLVQFVDDGDELPPAFSVTVSDGALSSNTVAASISYAPVNDAPVISSTSLTVAEGATVTWRAEDIVVADPDSGAFTFSVSELAGGYFQLADAAGSAIFSFTSAQLGAGWVQFVDDGDETPPRFSLTASDGDLSSTPVAASVTLTPVNDAPAIMAVTLTLAEGEVRTLTPADVVVADPDSSNFSFSIAALAGGFVQLATAPGTAVASFSSAQLADGIVQFVDDGDETPPRLSLQVSDGEWNSDATQAVVSYSPVNDAPALEVPERVTAGAVDHNENSAAVLTLSASDVESLSSNLRFSLTGGADAARFALDSVTGELRFAQAPDFENPDDANADGIYEVVLRVTDPEGAEDELALRVRVSDVNDPPVLVMPESIQFNLQPQPDQVVATVAGADEDAGDSVRFALVDDAEGRFAIDARTGEIRFTGTAPAAQGGGSTYTLLVEVTDSQGERRMRTLALVVPGAAPRVEMESMNIPRAKDLNDAADAAKTSSSQDGEDDDTRVAPAWAATEQVDDADARAVRERIAALLRELSGPENDVQLQREATPHRTVADVMIVTTASADNANANTLQDAVAALLANEGDAQAIRVADMMGRQWGSGRRSEDGSTETGEDALNGQQRQGQSEQMDQLLLKLTKVEHVASVGFSVGLVWWLTRGGGLLASAMMGAPAWKQVDLLAVMSAHDNEESEDEVDPDDEPEEVKAMFDRGAERTAATVVASPV